MGGRVVAYYRVSTAKQGESGLGLEAQRSSVGEFVRSGNHELVAEFTEIETGKGSNALEKRPELRSALFLARRQRAMLVIAKLDRLARNVHFVSGLLESGVDFIAVDMPHANKAMIQMHAVMSEWERDQISSRTKAALMAAKARGVNLGVRGSENLRRNTVERKAASQAHAMRLRGTIEGMKARGISQRAMVAELNAIGSPTPMGGIWRLSQLQRVLKRIEAAPEHLAERA